MKLPRSYQWNVALEKSFAGQVVSATYVGQAGRDLLRNEAIYQPNDNFASAFEINKNSARSNYTALQLQYRRPLSHGIQILANYTLSHSLDNVSNDVIGSTPVFYHFRAPATTPRSHSTFVKVFQARCRSTSPPLAKMPGCRGLPRIGLCNDVIVARSGFPFNALIYGYSPGGYASSRPDLVPGQPLWIKDVSAGGGKSLNPNAFAIPSTERQGTEGRNDIPGFGLTQVDLLLGRLFPIRERCKLQFRVDVFNLLNDPNFNESRSLHSVRTIVFSFHANAEQWPRG